VINLLKELARKEEILNSSTKIPPHNTPGLFKEKKE
jgi:hypothetical protein